MAVYNTAYKSGTIGSFSGTTVAVVGFPPAAGGTVHHFVNSTNNANGYPIEDSFYRDFNGINITNLIVTRG